MVTWVPFVLGMGAIYVGIGTSSVGCVLFLVVVFPQPNCVWKFFSVSSCYLVVSCVFFLRPAVHFLSSKYPCCPHLGASAL